MEFLNDKVRSFANPEGRDRRRVCRHIRGSYMVALSRRLGPDAPWIQQHLAACPRCRRRLAAWRRVELAFSAVKSQPHRLDLVRRANAGTVKMLSHDLRNAPQAQELAEVRTEPSFLERSGNYRHWATNVAACLVILFLAKSGLFSSFDRLSARSRELVRQYYVDHAGDDLAGEVFDA